LLLGGRPELLCVLLGIALPPGASVALGNADFTQAVPLERRADAVVTIQQSGAVTAAFVVEVQLAIKEDKRFAWPLYVASLHARLRCPTTLVVLALDDDVAAWARKPIATLQPASPFEPVVIGPCDIPRITSPDDAVLMPELAVLSALVHANQPDGATVAASAIHAVAQLDDAQAQSYYDLIYSSLGDLARAALEALMSQVKYEYQSDFAKKYVAQGEAQGRAEGEAHGRAEGEAQGRAEGEAHGRASEARKLLLSIMAARGLGPSAESRARVDACSDAATLERWVLRAATTTAEANVFAEA
jgi:hypothetical protein